MSLILDALRKMEQERKSRLGGSVDIRPEVLRYRSAVQPPARKPYLQTTVAVVLMVAGIGAGIFFRGGSRTGSVPEATVAALAPPVPVPQASLSPTPAPPAAAPLPAPLPTPPVAAAQPPVAAPPVAPKVLPAPYPAPYPLERTRALKGAKPAPSREVPQPQPAAVEDARGSSDLTVSGIAWQEERTLRRAVVNGALVGEGAEVAGARVVEIRETRVRFSRGGQNFDVSYASN